MSAAVQRTISPIDGSVYVERELAAPARIEHALETAAAAQKQWRRVPLEERAAIVTRFIDLMEALKASLAKQKDGGEGEEHGAKKKSAKRAPSHESEKAEKPVKKRARA